MYEIQINRSFKASHALRLPGGGLEEAHRHRWHVTVCVGCHTLDPLETAMDFHKLEQIVDNILTQLDGQNLNETPGFIENESDLDDRIGGGWNPSAERVAELIAKRVQSQINLHDPTCQERDLKVLWAQTTEAPGCIARYIMALPPIG